ncbi:hypothetical protein CAPTEDRAFT_21029 [Capitella teleta]|uniref:6-phosphogluconolactonase n=1 Tax=Capitella teleta TaxID=283909 RepID=R7TL06_CAPTE|nr:hypothetical protein CAPTEDRAFT_21029 [Capitella teleta]|eukprot:ELT94314.1 hypothetical protein CAPTEDRAFT_21029 [Capitella teleta]
MANNAIDQRGRFVIGLSGGSAAKFLCQGLPAQKTDWAKWTFFFCDERHVEHSDPECTYSVYKAGLFDPVGISPDQVFPDDPSLSVDDAAAQYSEHLKNAFPGNDLPRFDLLILGMGPDGHTCSLFPQHPLLTETSKLVAAIADSPKPPSQRITITFPVIQNCRCALFISCGASKADMVQRVLEGSEDLPAARVRPTDGDLVWFLDKGAASKLTCN